VITAIVVVIAIFWVVVGISKGLLWTRGVQLCGYM
jgi:hypothetical protein